MPANKSKCDGKTLPALARGERGQNTVEYLLVTGAVAVLMVGGLLVGIAALIPEVAGFVCPSVDTAANPIATVGSCITNIGG